MFKSARLKLTLWYLLTLFLVSASFSFIIYRFLSIEIDRFADMQRVRLERRFENKIVDREELKPPKPPIYIDPDLVADTKLRIVYTLFSINGGILVVFGTLSYFLSGKTLKPIKEMVDEQSRFVSDASHELRTPLASLKTAVEVGLRDKNLDLVESKKILRENLGDINRLTGLTNSLLELSRFQKGTDLLVLKNSKIKPLINQAILRLKIQAQAKNIRVVTKTGQSVINIDLEKITEVITIILDNAIKYSPKNTTIKVTTTKSRKYLHLKISDQGQGIDQKDLPFIFDRFYRSDSARSSENAEGFGLGLSIAKEIISLHRGTIKVYSKVGAGTTFDIILPITNSV
jgi:signal transduction histidine kinase